MELKQYLKRELTLVALCTLAALIGPTLWINVNLSILYIFPGLVFSVMCIAVSAVIYKVTSMLEKALVKPATKYITGIILGYLPILWIIINNYKNHPETLFRISGGEALMNFPFILGFLLIAVVFMIIKKDTVISAVFKAGMFFLLPFFLVIKLALLIPNSEGKVIFGNVAIIYFFGKIVLNWPVRKGKPNDH